jgi:hypothetical protein
MSDVATKPNKATVDMTAGSWMQNASVAQGQPTVSLKEVISLNALIAYAAHKTGISEFSVERSLSDRFSVPNIKFLLASDFEDAIKHLVCTVIEAGGTFP